MKRHISLYLMLVTVSTLAIHFLGEATLPRALVTAMISCLFKTPTVHLHHWLFRPRTVIRGLDAQDIDGRVTRKAKSFICAACANIACDADAE